MPRETCHRRRRRRRRLTDAPARDRLPGLDGLRACSIVEILIAHLALRNQLPWIPAAVVGVLAAKGGWGVTVFFVISGFLITHLLLLEDTRSGTINLSRFYVRRAIRIFPPALTYLAIVALAGAVGWVAVTRTELLASVFFFRNLVIAPDVYTGHFWSLAIEEQFYFCWPPLLKIVPSRWRIPVTAALCAAAPLWRTWHQHLAPNWDRFDFRYDSLLTGALVAMIAADPAWAKYVERVLRRPALLLVAALITLLLCAYWSSPVPGVVSLLMFPLQLWSTAIIILIVSRGLCSPAQAMLNARPVVWLGRVSYSLYLWQQPFLRAAGDALVQSFPVNVIAAFLTATLSYQFIERPAAKWRQRWRAGVRSSAERRGPSATCR